MWHVSTCAQAPGVHRGHLVAAAARVLAGAGNSWAGEWPLWGETPGGKPVYHLRRRLTGPEAAQLPHGGMIRDVRGTPEGAERIAVVAGEIGLDVETLQGLA